MTEYKIGVRKEQLALPAHHGGFRAAPLVTRRPEGRQYVKYITMSLLQHMDAIGEVANDDAVMQLLWPEIFKSLGHPMPEVTSSVL